MVQASAFLAPLLPPPPAMTGRHAVNKRWRLRITQQPESEFFKDEGGKNHALETVVRLEPLGSHHLSSRFAPGDFVVPLRASLYYESEKRVEESDQDILRMMATDPKSMWVRADDCECLVRFRIEKVSRRKDGQRFKVLFEADDSGECPDEFKHMRPVLTEPICVMSKRKAHAGGGRGRARRRGPVEDIVATLDPEVTRKMERMQEMIAQLRAHVAEQDRRLEALETTALHRPGGNGAGPQGSSAAAAAAATRPFSSAGLMGLAEAAGVHGGGNGEAEEFATPRLGYGSPRVGSEYGIDSSPVDGHDPGRRSGVGTRASARLSRRRTRQSSQRQLSGTSQDYARVSGSSAGRGPGLASLAAMVELDDDDLRGALALSRGSSRNGSPQPSPGGLAGEGAAGTMGSPVYSAGGRVATRVHGPAAYGAAASLADLGEGGTAAKRFRKGGAGELGGEHPRARDGAAPTAATLNAAAGGEQGTATGAAHVAASTAAAGPVVSATYPTQGGMMRASLVPMGRAVPGAGRGGAISAATTAAAAGVSASVAKQGAAGAAGSPEGAVTPVPEPSPPPRRLDSADMQFDFGPPGSPVRSGVADADLPAAP